VEILERYRVKLNEYRRWLAEFPDITLALGNLSAEAEGKESLSANYPPSDQGPWTITGLRDVLRRRDAAPDLLKALKHARGCGLLSPEPDSLVIINAAIAKAGAK
jgi:hypothetical protein